MNLPQLYVLPILYSLSSNNKAKEWKIWVEGNVIYIQWGYKYGKKQTSKVIITKGKNLGKANETTAAQQAQSEAKSKWNKQIDKGYGEKGVFNKNPKRRPMLAHNFTKRGHDIEWPAMVQPKFNGVRCLATKVSNDKILFLSRMGKEYKFFDHIEKDLLPTLKFGETFDGELYSDRIGFQEIISIVKQKKEQSASATAISYYVYDMITKDPFHARYGLYQSRLRNPIKNVVPVEAAIAKSPEEMKELHAEFIRKGYEGTIIRNRNGYYKEGHRSEDLQKYKDFVDDEFKIIGASEGRGSAKGTVIWECSTPCGKTFNVRPRGTVQQRKDWWENHLNFCGKKLTVRYQNLSEDCIPIFPVGIAIRDYEL